MHVEHDSSSHSFPDYNTLQDLFYNISYNISLHSSLIAHTSPSPLDSAEVVVGAAVPPVLGDADGTVCVVDKVDGAAAEGADDADGAASGVDRAVMCGTGDAAFGGAGGCALAGS